MIVLLRIEMIVLSLPLVFNRIGEYLLIVFLLDQCLPSLIIPLLHLVLVGSKLSSLSLNLNQVLLQEVLLQN